MKLLRRKSPAGRHAAKQPSSDHGVADQQSFHRRGGKPRVLQALDVHVAYGDEDVLKGVSFTVRPGQMLALTGPSGSGKSTLLWTLARLQPLRTGSILVDDAAIDDHDGAVQQGVVLQPQGNGLANMLTAYENVALPMLFTKTPAAETKERADGALAAVGLADVGHHLVDELSGGQQQRTAVARLVAGTSSILLADEPTSELDASNRMIVMKLLRAYADDGATVVVATHDPEAADVADGELRLHEGTPEWVRELPGG